MPVISGTTDSDSDVNAMTRKAIVKVARRDIMLIADDDYVL